MFMQGLIDIHSHILQGVDDGSPTLDNAIAALKRMQRLGVEHIILTPHYCKRRGYVTSTEKIRQAYDTLCDECEKNKISISLYLGTEMEYSTDAVRYISEKRVFTLADSSYILVEFAPYVSSHTILKACKEILQTGLVPVIAHVERYMELYNDMGTLRDLKELGVKLQVNIRSVITFSFRKKRFLRKIFGMEMVDFLAGDVHFDPIEYRELCKCRDFVVKHTSEQYFKKLVYENAKNILNGR